MTFDVYGRYRLDVERHEGAWRALRVAADGKRALMLLVIPSEVPESRLAEALDDLLHEDAIPGATVRRLEG